MWYVISFILGFFLGAPSFTVILIVENYVGKTKIKHWAWISGMAVHVAIILTVFIVLYVTDGGL